MRRIAIGITAAAVVIFTSGLSAQGKPNFAGKWTLDASSMPAGGGGGGGRAGGGGRGGGGRGFGGGGGGGFNCGQECTITQDAMKLVVTRTTQAGDQSLTFMLDGTVSKNPGFARGGGEAPMIESKVTWNGDKLVISTETPGRGGGAPVTRTQTLSLEDGKLAVEINTGREGATPIKQMFNKG